MWMLKTEKGKTEFQNLAWQKGKDCALMLSNRYLRTLVPEEIAKKMYQQEKAIGNIIVDNETEALTQWINAFVNGWKDEIAVRGI